MKLIIFVEVPRNASPINGELMMAALIEYFHGIGVVLQSESFLNKYYVVFACIKMKGIPKLNHEVILCNVPLTLRFFSEAKQFKRFVLNKEKRFITFKSRNLYESVEGDLSPLTKEFKGLITLSILENSNSHLSKAGLEEPEASAKKEVETFEYIIEIHQKKNSITAMKLSKINQVTQSSRIKMQKVKLFRQILKNLKEELTHRPSINYNAKPTTKIYHYLQKNNYNQDGKYEENTSDSKKNNNVVYRILTEQINFAKMNGCLNGDNEQVEVSKDGEYNNIAHKRSWHKKQPV